MVVSGPGAPSTTPCIYPIVFCRVLRKGRSCLSGAGEGFSTSKGGHPRDAHFSVLLINNLSMSKSRFRPVFLPAFPSSLHPSLCDTRVRSKESPCNSPHRIDADTTRNIPAVTTPPPPSRHAHATDLAISTPCDPAARPSRSRAYGALTPATPIARPLPAASLISAALILRPDTMTRSSRPDRWPGRERTCVRLSGELQMLQQWRSWSGSLGEDGTRGEREERAQRRL